MQTNVCVYIYVCTHDQGLVVHILLGSALATQACDVTYTVSFSYLCNLYNYKPMVLIVQQPGAYELPKMAKEHEITLSAGCHHDPKSIAKCLPYKESITF